jgi:hypothetical protein
LVSDMCEQRNDESRLDYHIRNTKTALNLENITEPYLNRSIPYGYPTEFGFDTSRISMVRRYLWLNAKLVALYLAKGFNRLSRRS